MGLKKKKCHWRHKVNGHSDIIWEGEMIQSRNYYNTNKIWFAKHYTFLFLLYNMINQWLSPTYQNLLLQRDSYPSGLVRFGRFEQSDYWDQNNRKIFQTCYFYIENYMQIVVSCSPHSFAKCFEQRLRIRELIINNGISSLLILLNSLDFHSFLVLIFARVQLKDNGSATSAGKFGKIIVIINLVAVIKFLEAIYTSIFKHFFTAKFTESNLLKLISTYFGMLKTNSWGMLHLSYLV